MKPKTMVLMVVAVACGLVASYMTSRLIAERNATPEAKPTAKVLVAKKKLRAMTPLGKPEDLLVEKEIPVDLVPKKAITSFDGLKDKRINKNINEDAFLTQDDLVTKETATLDYELPPGYRAVGLRVNAESQVSGFVLPRSRVDIVAVTRDGETEAKIILQDMLVLAVDMASERDLDKGKGMLGATVTLACLPEEATRLALAATMGDLRLLLRGPEDHNKLQLRASRRNDFGKPIAGAAQQPMPGDAEEADAQAVKIPELPDAAPPPQAAMAEPEAPPPAPEEPPQKKHVMTLVLGDSTQEITFFQDKDGSWKKGPAKVDLDEPREPRAPRPRLGFPPAKPGADKPKEADAPAPAKKPETLQEKLLKNSGLPPVEAGSKQQ